MAVKKVSIYSGGHGSGGSGGGHGRGNIRCDDVDEVEMTEVMLTAVTVGRMGGRWH